MRVATWLTLAAFVAAAGMAVAGPDPLRIVAAPYAPISADLWLGADGAGRDLAARVAHGALASFGLALLAAIGATVVGGGLGAWAGFVGGVTDQVLTRATEATLALPKLPLLLLLAAIELPGGVTGQVAGLVVLLAFMAWPGPARLARGTTRLLRNEGYVTAARGYGASTGAIWRLHLLPRVTPTLAVGAAGDVAELMLLESVISFLGFGIPEPWPSLGNLLSEGLAALYAAPQVIVVPGALTGLVVATLHEGADRIREATDPYAPKAPGR